MACRRCGVCCTRHQAQVRPDEVRRIAAFLGITPDEWERLYADPRWDYSDYRLVRHVSGACAFLEDSGGVTSCAVQSVKPACCSGWQPGPDKRECRKGLLKLSPERAS